MKHVGAARGQARDRNQVAGAKQHHARVFITVRAQSRVRGGRHRAGVNVTRMRHNQGLRRSCMQHRRFVEHLVNRGA